MSFLRSIPSSGGTLVLAACSLLLAGCATERHAAVVVPHTGDPVADATTMIASGPAKDRVLWECRMAAALMRRGQPEQAKPVLDDALRTMGSISVDDKSAKKARSYFSEESKKNFHGEPYERVMAYYYRGIIYWMDGEPDNARACFRNAEIQDSDAENKQYAADYVLLDYLDGLVSAKLGQDGSDAYQRAAKESRFGRPPAYNPKENALFFVEYGQGPTKYATGEYNEELRFIPGSSVAQSVLIKVNNQNLGLRPYDDLTFQANTRGGRVMDHILANKAVFKNATDIAGSVGLVGGLGMAVAGNGATREAGLGLAAAGLVSKIVSAVTTPAADTRAWDNLPQFLSFAGVELAPGQYTATVEFLDGAGRPVPNMAKNVTFTVVPNRDTVIFLSDRRS